MRQAPEPDKRLSVPARAAVIAALVGLDQLTKLWAVRWLKPKALIPVCPFFQFVYVENTGMAFGLGRHRNDFFLILSAALLLALFHLQKIWARKNFWIQIGLLLIISGALGNILDRIIYGHVVDFLDLQVLSHAVFNVFNVADSCVSAGAVCLGIGILKDDAEEKRLRQGVS